MQVGRTDPCDFCVPGKFTGQTGTSVCKHCSAGFYSNKFGQSACVECAEGTYNLQDASTVCSKCSTLKIQSCQKCLPNGETPVRYGWCLAQEECYQSLTPSHTDYLPDPMDARFEGSTEHYGCQFCSSDSVEMLAQVVDSTPCPGKRCGIEEDHEFVCSEGQCAKVGPARSCSAIKECYACRDELRGCELMEYHCLLPAGGCGCMIDDTCYPREATKPGNSCLEASLPGESIGMRHKCTGSWTPTHDPTASRVEQCAGEAACQKNQRCENGECKSVPYDFPPDPCIASYTCTGNDHLYEYEFLTPEMLPKQCHFPNFNSTCELPAYCSTQSTKCPGLAFLVPLFNESVDHILEILSADAGLARAVSLPFVLKMLHQPEIIFDNGRILSDCSTDSRSSSDNIMMGQRAQRIDSKHRAIAGSNPIHSWTGIPAGVQSDLLAPHSQITIRYDFPVHPALGKDYVHT